MAIDNFSKELDKATKQMRHDLYYQVNKATTSTTQDLRNTLSASKRKATSFYNKFQYKGAFGGAFHEIKTKDGYTKKRSSTAYTFGVSFSKQQLGILDKSYSSLSKPSTRKAKGYLSKGTWKVGSRTKLADWDKKYQSSVTQSVNKLASKVYK